MTFNAMLSVLLVSAAFGGLVGCKKNSPVGPDVVQTSTIAPRAPLPMSTVAPYVGQTINTVAEAALKKGLTATGAGRWTSDCSAGGTGRFELPDNYRVGSGSVVELEDTGLVFTDCAMDTNINALQQPSILSRLVNLFVRPAHAQSRARIVARGRLRTRGRWRPPIMSGGRWTYRDGDVRTTGDLDVSQTNCGGGTCPSQIGPIQLDCGINGSVCAGSIGGVGVTQGPPDTPPPPNPTTTTTSTIPGPGAVNISGIWNVTIKANCCDRVSLTQNGSTITGTTLGIASGGGVTVTANSVTGTISGSNVSLTQVLGLRASADGVTITTTVTSRYTLQATSTRMTGSFTSSSVVSGPVPIPSANDSGSSTWNK
jgi:hypothetical protein